MQTLNTMAAILMATQIAACAHDTRPTMEERIEYNIKVMKERWNSSPGYSANRPPGSRVAPRMELPLERKWRLNPPIDPTDKYGSNPINWADQRITYEQTH